MESHPLLGLWFLPKTDGIIYRHPKKFQIAEKTVSFFPKDRWLDWGGVRLIWKVATIDSKKLSLTEFHPAFIGDGLLEHKDVEVISWGEATSWANLR